MDCYLLLQQLVVAPVVEQNTSEMTLPRIIGIRYGILKIFVTQPDVVGGLGTDWFEVT